MESQVKLNASRNLHAIPALQEVQIRAGVVLRPLREEDARELLAILDSDPSIRDQVTAAARFHSEEDVKQEVASYTADASMIRYVIVSEDQCVGLISFWLDTGYFGYEPEPHVYGFGYFLSPAARGKGLVTDSIKALMNTASSNFPVAAFIAFCTDENVQSTAALKRLGFESTDRIFAEPNHGWLERMYEKRVEDGK